MNPNNYASLEASKRLVETGIVIETETVWRKNRDRRVEPGYYLTRKALYHRKTDIPAPCMAEVWRELKEGGQFPCSDGDNWWLCDENVDEISPEMSDLNPTDALIDLLIWVRKEASHE
jgi:hypothetical protein